MYSYQTDTQYSKEIEAKSGKTSDNATHLSEFLSLCTHNESGAFCAGRHAQGDLRPGKAGVQGLHGIWQKKVRINDADDVPENRSDRRLPC